MDLKSKSSAVFAMMALAAYSAVLQTGALANIPGGGTGTGPDITLASNSTSATLGNGVVSIRCTKSGATIDDINYTFDNGTGTQTLDLLAGGNNGGQLYWGGGTSGFGTGVFAYSVIEDPATNGGDYAEIQLLSTSPSNGEMEVHFSMRRGSPGFYVTVIWRHRGIDGAMTFGEARDNIYAGSIFNWMSVDATRNRLMHVSGETSIGVYNAPVEVSLWTSGIYQGQYEDKYKYSADCRRQNAWGWSSVGAGGKNVGLWNVTASHEYYAGGPMKRENQCHNGTTILNVLNSSHFGLGTDGAIAAGEEWTKVSGPYFIYCNKTSAATTDPVQASQALYNDALAQAAAEQTAWPYDWFNHPSYTPASGRGSVTGQIHIDDSFNPNASAAGLWVGLIRQPAVTGATYDFQQWSKDYQYWTLSDSSGNFTLPDVIAGPGYTLYAFGPGAAGTYQSQPLTGGSAPNTLDIPASPFSVTVAGGGTTSLGAVTWTPARVGPTVFEIGSPDRTAAQFRHGEDWWVGGIGPGPDSPSPVWTKFLEYPFDFPNGPNYVVGQSRWTTDWNFIQPTVIDAAGNFIGSTSTITFHLESAPGGSSQASFYHSLASDFQGPLIIKVNGTNIAGSNGYSPDYSGSEDGSNASIREGNHGIFSDKRITFAGSLLHQGQNTITINMRKPGGAAAANHAMYDYVRLELTGYTPPAPDNVVAYAGNNANLVYWPVTPGATTYNVLRSETSGTSHTTVATGITGPVCGSGPEHATYLDTTAANGTNYHYVVRSVNPAGTSADSPESAGAAPSNSGPISAPAAPTGIVATPADRSVSLSWNASAGADFYTVRRSTLTHNGVGSYNTLGTIILSNTVTGTGFTDSSPTNGSVYSYSIAASNAAGTSVDSNAAIATPVSPAPASAPGSLVATALQGSNSGDVTLQWTPVPGAVGYVVKSAPTGSGPYTLLVSLSATTVTVGGNAANTTVYYQVAANNSGGTSSFTTASAVIPPAAPTSLIATPGNGQVVLSWPAVPGATSYVVRRSLTSGNGYSTVNGSFGSPGFTDTGLMNGTTYYYVVAATGAGGTGPNSAETFAIPGTILSGPGDLLWTGATGSAWDTSSVNWKMNGTSARYADASDVTFADTASSTTVSISGTVLPASVAFENTATNYLLGGGVISGPTSLTKDGSGTLTVNNTNSYTGDTIVSGGVIELGTAGAAIGSGSIQLGQSAVFRMASSSGNFPANPVHVADGASATLSSANLANTYGGTISGASDSTLNFSGPVSLSVSGSAQLSGFNGQVVITSGSQLRFSNNAGANGNGGAGASFQVDGKIYTRNKGGAGGVVLGSLSGTGRLEGQTNTVAGEVTYFVGAKNLDSGFSGVIANGANGTAALTKVGTGVLTLSGSNTYTGPTTVSSGILKITGTIAGSSSMTVASGASAHLAGGSLSVTGGITNHGTVKLSGTATINSGGNFINNGVLDLINGSASLPQNFVNNGAVIDSSVVKVQYIQLSGMTFSLTIHGYPGHDYQLQKSATLVSGAWSNIGAQQAGSGTLLMFSDMVGASGTKSFYRIVVTP